MTLRRILGVLLLLSFIVVATTGIVSYFTGYSQTIASLHTIFGVLFILGIAFHLKVNFRIMKGYLMTRKALGITVVYSILFAMVFLQVPPVRYFMDLGAKMKSKNVVPSDFNNYHKIEMGLGKNTKLSVDLKSSEYYWYPQIAIWTEDLNGHYLETLFVTNATAKGLFYGGRTKENFKSFDASKHTETEYRRVNALPVWSHKRGMEYIDGAMVPSLDEPLPDTISGATPQQSFILETSLDYTVPFVVKVEINVAFDDNEFYSEYDFPDDGIFHNGTGQLGQPSLVYQAKIDQTESKRFYVMELLGHGHHSAQNGRIYGDLSTLTTSLGIVERIVVGIHSKNNALAHN